jgi:hypothetical protein
MASSVPWGTILALGAKLKSSRSEGAQSLVATFEKSGPLPRAGQGLACGIAEDAEDTKNTEGTENTKDKCCSRDVFLLQGPRIF